MGLISKESLRRRRRIIFIQSVEQLAQQHQQGFLLLGSEVAEDLLNTCDHELFQALEQLAAGIAQLDSHHAPVVGVREAQGIVILYQVIDNARSGAERYVQRRAQLAHSHGLRSVDKEATYVVEEIHVAPVPLEIARQKIVEALLGFA